MFFFSLLCSRSSSTPDPQLRQGQRRPTPSAGGLARGRDAVRSRIWYCGALEDGRACESSSGSVPAGQPSEGMRGGPDSHPATVSLRASPRRRGQGSCSAAVQHTGERSVAVDGVAHRRACRRRRRARSLPVGFSRCGSAAMNRRPTA
jgi:hypothetical protein